MKLSSFLWVLIAASAITSCRKNDNLVAPPVSLEDQVKDSVLANSRDAYLWNTQIPGDFNARSYAGPDEIMKAIRAYSSEPGFPDPVDHYSFAMKKAEYDNLSSGVTSDFGLKVFFFTDNDLRVRSVEKASPAGMAGIKRGWKLIKIDGNTSMNTDNIDFVISKVFESPSTSFTFEKPDGSTLDITLNAATYQENPILLDTVYTEGAKTVGYLVFNSFFGNLNEVKLELGRVFNHFAIEGVTDMIVDLRYNGGGYVSLQQTLANYLVKPSGDGNVMMGQVFNSNLTQLNETSKFKKLGVLDVNNIYFVVTDNTASASELLINNLKPYMNVKLVGPEATYGKPVGFFPIPVGDWYIFPVSFRSVNSRGQGNYFDGIPVDNLVTDGVDKDWGDRTESSLASILHHIGTGAFAAAPPMPGLNSTLETQRKAGNNKLERNSFKGAVGER